MVDAGRFMQALSCRTLGGLEALRIDDVAVPQPGPRGVRVRVHACALNFPDVLMVQGKYQRKPPLPFSPGGEFSGVVESVGEAVGEFKPGDRVCGIADHGGLAEFIVVDLDHVYGLPDSVEMDQAAALLYTYGTSLYALRDRGLLAAGESLLVLGAGGGIGIAAVELGKAMGARVVAAASAQTKLDLARAKGADECVVYGADLSDPSRQKAFANELKGLAREGGFDVVCDPVGGAYTEPALRAMGWAGRYLVIGFAAGEIPKIPLNLPLLKSCQIVGVLWGAAKQRDPAAMKRIHRDLIRMFAEGRITPHIGARFDFGQAVDGLRMLAERRALGKVIVYGPAAGSRA